MNDLFNIYIERLRGGDTQTLTEEAPSTFLDVHEKDLSFKDSVTFKGKAYLANDMVIIQLDAIANAIIPCRICNEPTSIKVHLNNFYHAEPIANIKSRVFNFKDLLREAILLEVPHYVECNEGQCPQRAIISKYLKKTEEE